MSTADTIDIPTVVGKLHVTTCGTGPVAVMWHSLFADSRSWEPVLESLASQRTLVLIDGPSHGRSEPAARRFTIAECAQSAIEILDTLGYVEPVDWVGNAWGGHVGMAFAAAHADRCGSLIAFASPINALSRAERRRIVPLVALFRLLGARRFLCDAVVEAMFTPEVLATRPSVAGYVRDVIVAADRRGLYLAMQSMMLGRPDFTAVLRDIKAPTMLVAGDDDELWTPAAAQKAVSSLSHARAACVTGSCHIPSVEAPEQVVALVGELWASAGISTGG
jgi:pimeloyl-ACP methyl ester carboxylesterase